MPTLTRPYCALLFVFLSTVFLSVRAAQPNFLPQSWYFDWNPAGTTVPIPISQQCETLHISWQRGPATGPNPTAPYYLQIYTSAFIVPFTVAAGSGTSFDWAVPFSPGTQYQICMFDQNGATGGCQAIYTVIANTSTAIPSCANVTFPAGAMNVKAAVADGAFSQYGWIPQCTDIAVTPVNGTPPYIFTVAPTLRPPLNITSSNTDTINWTDTLAFGLPFFISVIDSQGNKWSQGPLHSAAGQDNCLSLNAPKSSGTGAIAGGSAVAGLVAGAVCTALGFFVAARVHARRHPGQRYLVTGKSSDSMVLEPSESLPLGHHANSASSSSRAGGANILHSYHVEPFTLSPGLEQPLLPLSPPPPPPPASASGSGSGSGSGSASQSGATESGERRGQVYVVHHDAGRAPVTVYTDDGIQVTELPPSYMDNRLPRQRSPRSLPGKPSGSRPEPSR